MSVAVKLVPVQEAYDDLLNRTLSRITIRETIITRDWPAASARRLHAKRWKSPTGRPFIRFPLFRWKS